MRKMGRTNLIKMEIGKQKKGKNQRTKIGESRRKKEKWEKKKESRKNQGKQTKKIKYKKSLRRNQKRNKIGNKEKLYILQKGKIGGKKFKITYLVGQNYALNPMYTPQQFF